MMKRFFVSLALGAGLALPAIAQQQDEKRDYIDLGYNFQKGQQFELKQESRSETYTTVDDVMKRVSRDFNNTIAIEVTDISPSHSVLSFRYKELKFTFNARNQNILVDANVPNDKEPFQAALKSILNHPFSVDIQNSGFINKVTGLDELLDKASATFTNLKKDEQDAYKKLMMDQFGTNAFRSWLEQLLVIYPVRSIKTGTRWEENVPIRTGLVGNIDLYWNLQTWDAQTAKINGTGKVTTNKVETFTIEDGIEATAEINGDIMTNYLIDRNTGMPSICAQNTEMNGTYTYKANKAKRIKKDIKVPVKIVTNASYKIKQMK
ncbi:DUF6263 family protein [Chitinophaga tropicalis]|uniref:Uncharacterized protein n=1 Tax=Chitinophaga tropicalis TaxID=2683588 RepID=A0A7K1TXZ6_9BACT|nr:DUF6263 family protein [Chitinophaga tropicalis]MVT06900.1 hypothetical protein [Chitinophaga tropicalis]